MYNALITFLGISVPTGYEFPFYVMTYMTSLFLLNSLVSFFHTVFRGGK